jgi:hypothetical protein
MYWIGKVVAALVLVPTAGFLLIWSWGEFREHYHRPSTYLVVILCTYALGVAILIRVYVEIGGEQRPRRCRSKTHRAIVVMLVLLTLVSIWIVEAAPWHGQQIIQLGPRDGFRSEQLLCKSMPQRIVYERVEPIAPPVRDWVYPARVRYFFGIETTSRSPSRPQTSRDRPI